MGEIKKDLGERSQFVSKGSIVARKSSNTDIISTKGGFRDVPTIRRGHTRQLSNDNQGTEHCAFPSSSREIDGAGIVYGLFAALFFWGVALFLIFWVEVATAEGLHVVHARGDRIAPVAIAKAEFAEAVTLINKQTNRGLYAKSFESRRTPWQRVHNSGLSGRATLLHLWSKYFIRRNRTPGIALVSTFNERGLKYMAGYANRCGAAGYATVQDRNQFGESRYVHSVITIAHELGHLIGAAHDDSSPVTIMNSNVIPYSSLSLKFSEKSMNEIGRCRR